MLYHPSEHILSKIIKLIAFWASIFVMLVIITSLLIGDFNIVQRTAEIEVELKNHVNICVPDDDYFVEF